MQTDHMVHWVENQTSQPWKLNNAVNPQSQALFKFKVLGSG